MRNFGGYAGKILTVDLSNRSIQESNLNWPHVQDFIGGAGYAARILYDIISPVTDAFSPDNALFFVAGPMVGSGFPGTTKWTVCARSPLTNIWGESSASGSWGIEMKLAGYDGLLIKGRSSSPVYLAVKDEHAEIVKADGIWGEDTIETAKAITLDIGEARSKIASIGPAGERLVRYASIVTNEERLCGRGGMGAVMGSKKLKAIAIRGTGRLQLASEERVQQLSKNAREAVRLPKAPAYTAGRVKGLSADGTASGLEGLEKQGGLPVKNWTRGTFPGAVKISGPTMTNTILEKPGMCAHCTIITCWRYVRTKQGKTVHGPEYETLAALGSLCMNENLESIVRANELCNRIGMDTISTGSAIAFAMECYEKGILSSHEVDGLDLSWGNSETIVKLTESIGFRKGFGDALAEGVKRASEKIGKGSEKYAIHVKGLELPMHDPRRWWTMALSYATGNRGACHHQGVPAYLEWGYLQPEFGFSEKLKPMEIEGKAEATKFHQDFHAAFTSMGHCAFTVGGVIPFTIVTEAFNAVTGRQVSHWDLLKHGERIWNMKRAFNIKMGTTQKDDTLPDRLLKEPLAEGVSAGRTPPLPEMIKEYYSLRGWKEGHPSKEKLIELGMVDVSRDLWK